MFYKRKANITDFYTITVTGYDMAKNNNAALCFPNKLSPLLFFILVFSVLLDPDFSHFLFTFSFAFSVLTESYNTVSRS